MEPLFLVPFLLLGVGVIFIAYSGGAGPAREAYLTRGNTFFKIAIPVLYGRSGIAIPRRDREQRAEGRRATPARSANTVRERDARGGQDLFQNTAPAATRARPGERQGVTGRTWTRSADSTRERRPRDAIKNGGTGQGRMPANLLQGEDAEAVALRRRRRRPVAGRLRRPAVSRPQPGGADCVSALPAASNTPRLRPRRGAGEPVAARRPGANLRGRVANFSARARQEAAEGTEEGPGWRIAVRGVAHLFQREPVS